MQHVGGSDTVQEVRLGALHQADSDGRGVREMSGCGLKTPVLDDCYAGAIAFDGPDGDISAGGASRESHGHQGRAKEPPASTAHIILLYAIYEPELKPQDGPYLELLRSTYPASTVFMEDVLAVIA